MYFADDNFLRISLSGKYFDLIQISLLLVRYDPIDNKSVLV